MDLQKLVNEFLEHLEIERNCSALTIRDYRHYLTHFLEWLKDVGSSPTEATLDVELVRRYRLHLSRFVNDQDQPLKRVTQGYYVIALRSFLKYLAKRDIDTLSPEKIDIPKGESRSLKFLTHDQLQRLFTQPDTSQEAGLRDRAILETLFSTGMRISELVKLKIDQLNFVQREFGIIGKGGRARVVFLSDEAVEWIQKYLHKRTDGYSPLFIRYGGQVIPDKNGQKMGLSARSVQRLVEKYVRKSCLPVKATPHTIRHSFATDLLVNGADIRSVQELLGHKNIGTTQIYTHVTDQRLREVHKEFHNKK